MNALIGLIVAAVCVQVALSASCGCSSKPNWSCDSWDSSNGDFLPEEIINVDQNPSLPSCGCNQALPSCGCTQAKPSCGCNYPSSNCQECKHFQLRQQEPIVIRQPNQQFVLQPAPINIYPRIHQSSANVNFAPQVYTKQSPSNVHIKPVIVKVEKEAKGKMVCRYEHVPDHQCDSSCGWPSLPHQPSCGCGCNK